MSLLFNTLSRFVIAFFQGASVLISWLQSLYAVILEPNKKKICHCFHFFPFYLPWSDGTGCHDLSFFMLSFKPAFSLSPFTLIKRLFRFSFHFVITMVSSTYLRLLIFLQQSWFQLVLLPAQHFTCCTLHGSYISRVTVYSLDVLLSQFWTSLLFHVCF